jgi:tetratricopeptide (TPR) repeat protein
MKIHLLFRPPENRTEDHKLKLWSAYHSRETDSTEVDLYLFRLLPYLVFGSLIAYFTLALMLFVWISRKPQKDVGYWDVVTLPFDWEEFQKKRGRLFIEAGEQDILEKKFRTGIMKIRIGLNKYPEDRESRVFLAQVYYAAGLVDPAHDLMIDGIRLGINDNEFLLSFFNLCYEAEAYESVIEVADLLLVLPDFKTDPEKHFIINRHKVTSLLELGRIDEALNIAHKINTDPNGIRRMIDAEYLALIKSGEPIEALAFLEKWRFRMDLRSVQLQNIFIDTYIELKDDKKLKQAIQDLVALDRFNPDFYVLAMKKWHRAGKQKELEDAFTSYMLLYAWDPANLRKVNNFVTSVREIPLVEQVLNFTRKRGMNEEVILFNLFYAYLMDGRWDEASGVLDLLKGAQDSFSPIDQRLIGIGETIVLLNIEQRDNLRLLLLQELRRLRASIPFYITVSNILRESGLFEVAVDTLEQAMAIFPHSKRIEKSYRETAQSALQHIRENQIEEEIEVLELGPNEYLDQLDAFLANGNYDETADLLTEINRIGAPWLQARREDFEYRKLQLYFETRDNQLQSQSTTLFLSSNPDSGPELVQLALSYLDKGKAEQSRILVEEVVRNNPRNREARDLLETLGGPREEFKTAQQPDNQNDQAVFQSKTKVIGELTEKIEAQDWKSTEKLVQQTLRASPPWLTADRQEFDLLHIRYYLESGNFPSASSLIRIFMGSDAKSARVLLNLATDYHNRGMDTEMNFLVEQVIRRFPNMKL